MRPIHLPIANPCDENWDAMEPRERGRFCARCDKDVHDLSSMTEDDARAFLRERAGTRICVNYRPHADGSVAFRGASRTIASTAATAVAMTALAACTPHDRPRTDPTPIEQAANEPVELEGSTPAIPIEAPAVQPIRGEMVAPPAVEPPLRKGDVEVPNEPCDPPQRERTTGTVTAPK